MRCSVQRRLIGFAEPGTAVRIRCRRFCDKGVQDGLPVLCLCQPVGIVALTVVALLQLIPGCLERTLILIHDLPLEGQLLLKG